VASITKLFVASGEDLWLAVYDPVFPKITVRMLMVFGGALELAACLIVLMLNKTRHKVVILCMLSGMILGYRAYRSILGVDGSCRCFGKTPEMMGVSASHVDLLAMIFAASIYVSGVMVLSWLKTATCDERDNETPHSIQKCR
jgi:hypothetical protein